MLYTQNYREINRLYKSSDGEINRSHTSISLSSRGAFSYEWNNHVNKYNFCVVKFLKSSKAFLQSLFCGYSVNIVKVEEFYIKNRICENTIFLDEYNMKLEERNILMKRAEAYAKNPQKTHVERQESKRADNNATTNNHYGQAFLQTQTNDPSEEWKGTEREVVVFSELKKAVEDEDFKDFDRYFSQENIALLSVKEYEWLFNSSFLKLRAEILSRLLVTETGPYLRNIMGRKETAILILLINNGLLPGVIHLVEECDISVNSSFENITPLIVSAIHGYVECIDWLLKKGAAVNAIGKLGLTALHCAAEGGHLECLNRLLDEGAFTDENRYKAQSSPLHLSALHGHTECVNVLIDAGYDINQSNYTDGNAPLHASIMAKQMDSFKVLLKNEYIDIYKENRHGETPFHCAASTRDSTEFLQLLINVAGSDYFNKENSFGNTPYDYAVVFDIKKNIDILAPYNLCEGS